MALTRTARTNGRGRAMRASSATAKSRASDLSKFYGRALPSLTPGDFEFVLTLLRGAGADALELGDLAEAFEWSDQDTAMSGSVTLRRPDPEDPGSLPIGRGHRIRCSVKWDGRTYILWTMRCEPPETTIAEDTVVQVGLADDLDIVSRGRRHYLRRARKGHLHGYFGHAVLREFAREEGIELGSIVKCKHRMTKIDVTGSFLDLVVKIYENERIKTGHRFVVRMRNGKLEVVTYTRNREVYVLADQIRQAVEKLEPKVEQPVTILVGKGRVGKGKKAKVYRHTEFRRDMVERFGSVRKEKDYGRVDSLADLRGRVQRELARQYRVERTADIQHAGIPFIRRGDAAGLVLESAGFEGDETVVFCSGGSHQVQGGSYTSSWSFTTEDPFLADKAQQEKEARARARRKKKAS